MRLNIYMYLSQSPKLLHVSLCVTGSAHWKRVLYHWKCLKEPNWPQPLQKIFKDKTAWSLSHLMSYDLWFAKLDKTSLSYPTLQTNSCPVFFRRKIASFSIIISFSKHSSVQFSSVAQSCLTLCDPMNCSTQGLPVHHQLPELTQTHGPRVSDAIQPSHPLLSPSPPAPSPSQHQSLFQWVNSSHEVAKVLEFQL